MRYLIFEMLFIFSVTAPDLRAEASSLDNFVFTSVDIERIDHETGATARGGTIRVVQCDGDFGYSTIQSAVDAAADGDVIVVLPNDCTEDGVWREPINYKGKTIRIQGPNPYNWDTVAAVRLSWSAGDLVATWGDQDSPSEFAELAGITLESSPTAIAHRNCNFLIERVRFVQCAQAFRSFIHFPQFHAEFRDCYFSQNTGAVIVSCVGIGVYLFDDCLFLENSGALQIGEGSANVRGCRFQNNQATPLKIRPGIESIQIDRCAFTKNSGETGGISIVTEPMTAATVHIKNSVLSENTGLAAGVIHVAARHRFRSVSLDAQSLATVRHCAAAF